MADQLTHRFREGWVMLRRGFEFAELDYYIPKMSLVYVYSERPIYKMRIKDEYWERLNTIEAREARIPEFLRTNDMQSEWEPTDDEQYEEYNGEMVQTLFSGNLTKFYPKEYTETDITKYQNREDFHKCFKLRKNDEMYLKQEAMVNKVHYLCSRGMSREHAELYASPASKHSVWYEPTDVIKEYFKHFEPLKDLRGMEI